MCTIFVIIIHSENHFKRTTYAPDDNANRVLYIIKNILHQVRFGWSQFKTANMLVQFI